MLNYLWGGMLLAGMLWGACNGTWNEVTQALLDSAKESVSLGLTMLGILSFWCGIMEIGSQCRTGGVAYRLYDTRTGFLFPELGRDHPAREPIAVNIIANMLGLGMAATPAGISAMQEMAKDIRSAGDEMRTATASMCTFMILNISSLQLIPGYAGCLPEPVWIQKAGGGTGACSGSYGVIHTHGSSFLQGNGLEEQEDDPFMILWLSKILLPFVISYVIAFGLISRRPIFNDFLDGAKDGMKTVADILPTLIGLIAAVGVVRASGLLDAVTGVCARTAGLLHIPRELVPIILVRLVSSSQPPGFCWICFDSTDRTAALAWQHRS